MSKKDLERKKGLLKYNTKISISPRNSVLRGGVTFKALSAAALTTLAASYAQAETAPVPMANSAKSLSASDAILNKPYNVPTLDYLHDNNIMAPPEQNEYGDYISGSEKVYSESSYTMIEVSKETAESMEDVMTRYEVKEVTRYYDKTTGAPILNPTEAGITAGEYKVVQEKDLVPHYYHVGFRQTEYGQGPNGVTLGFRTYGGNYIFDEYGDKSVITVNYDKNNSRPQFSNFSDTAVDVEGDFVDNNDYMSGGVENTGKIGTISGNFINNIGQAGGAIYNGEGVIDTINGNFIGNITYSGGGAIYNGSDIREASLEFFTAPLLDNYIRHIEGDFIGNHNNYSTYSAMGGAIFNQYNIGDIKGNFIGNHIGINGVPARSYSSYDDAGFGGAIYNRGNISDISGDFIGNYVNSYYNAFGGAIANEYTMGSITGDFIGNYASGSGASGGAISNGRGGTGFTCIIGDITGDFIGNYAKGSGAFGGAITNRNGYIESITGDFIGNNVYSFTDVYGGGIYNQVSVGGIGSITGDFISNSATSDYGGSGYVYGGAIYNKSNIGDITGDFVNNFAKGPSYTYGGAIYNNYSSTIRNITGDFIGNYASASGYNDANGGAIYNKGNIGDITGDFVNNYAKGSREAVGGAIYNESRIGNVSGNFVNNYVQAKYGASGGAIYNGWGGPIGISKEVINVYIEPEVYTNEQTGEVINNYNIEISDYENKSLSPYEAKELIAQGYKIKVKKSHIFDATIPADEWENLKADIEQGINAGYCSYTDPANDIPKEYLYDGGGIVNSSFIGNYAKATEEGSEAKGGAIYTWQDLNLIAKDGYTSIISGNWVEDSNGKRDEAIFAGYESLLTFDAKRNGSFIINDKINGENYSIDFRGDETGVVYLNNDVIEEPEPMPVSLDLNESRPEGLNKGNVNVSLSNIKLHLANRDNVLDGNNLTLYSGNLSMINNQVGVMDLNGFDIQGDTNFEADVDLANQSMDRITANEYGQPKPEQPYVVRTSNNEPLVGNLNVVGMNLLSDAPENREITEIFFAEQGLKDHVTNGISGGSGELPQKEFQTTAYTPIFKYNVKYDNRDDGGYFMFAKGDRIFEPGSGGGTNSSGNPSDAFNPAVLATPTANIAASQATINETFKYVFQHADSFTQLPSLERVAQIKQNQYALSTDYNQNLGSLAPEFNNKAGWFRPYVTFEKMNLKNGPSVNATTYGSLAGFDSDFQKLKHGWTGLTTGYIGYNGSQLRYSGVDTTMNGGLLGVTQTFYKGNFWTALTASAGASVGQSHTMYGKEDFTSLMAGIGSKTGYNFEFKDGRYIIQPIMFMSYTFVNTFDYTNAAGVRIDADPMHSIMLNPSVRFITNTKTGWQPYASVGMVWNVLSDSNVKANNVHLPEASMKPYVEYGLGVQKRFKDRYTAFAQAMLRHGGRNGIALTGGFRWTLGKEGKPIEKVSNPQKVVQSPCNISLRGMQGGSNSVRPVEDKVSMSNYSTTLAKTMTVETTGARKIIKQMTTEQKIAKGLVKQQDTTLTQTRAVLKPM